MAVVRCPRMADALQAILAAPPPPPPQLQQPQQQVSRAGGACGAEAAALYAARPAAAALLRALAQSSPTAARAARSLGESSVLCESLLAMLAPQCQSVTACGGKKSSLHQSNCLHDEQGFASMNVRVHSPQATSEAHTLKAACRLTEAVVS